MVGMHGNAKARKYMPSVVKTKKTVQFHFHCFFWSCAHAEYQTLFGVGGFDYDVYGYKKTTWTVSFNDSYPSCSTGLANFPVTVSEAVAALVQDSPVVCGGRDLWSTDCHKYVASSGEWQHLASMTTQRAGAMVVQINEDDFWILGKKIKAKSKCSITFSVTFLI